MRNKLVAGNWKMNGGIAQNKALLDGVAAGFAALLSSGDTAKGVQCAVCVPFPYLFQAQSVLQGSKLAWGAQNLSQYEKGAYTGEVSASMLRDFACRYVIVGHSERRALYGESDAVVAEKFEAAINAGLIPILCVGETLAARAANVTEQVVARQLDAVVVKCGAASLAKAVVAYEPVWAIGTGKTASPEQAQAVHAFVRNKIAQLDGAIADGLQILYGGSMKASNAVELLSMADIDGGLIGGAALDADEFLAICRAAQR
ncbi:MAG: triose-phosphate isomerase [Burkholderiales bacterium]